MEAKVVQQINTLLKKEGWFQVNLMQANISGIPDRLIYKNGKYIWLEIKQPGGKLSPIQKYVITGMKSAGMEIYVVYSVDEVRQIINP